MVSAESSGTQKKNLLIISWHAQKSAVKGNGLILLLYTDIAERRVNAYLFMEEYGLKQAKFAISFICKKLFAALFN